MISTTISRGEPIRYRDPYIVSTNKDQFGQTYVANKDLHQNDSDANKEDSGPKLDEFGFKSTPYYKLFIQNNPVRNVKSVSPKKGRHFLPFSQKRKKVKDSFDEILKTVNINKMTKKEIAEF